MKKTVIFLLFVMVGCGTAVVPKAIEADAPLEDMLNPQVLTRYQGISALNYKLTICKVGYTKTIRPSTSYTAPLERHQIDTYGYSDLDPSNYEEDHVISLELGGHPKNPANLYPEKHEYSRPDDILENELHRKVCQGDMTLMDAQKVILRTKIEHGYNREKSVA